MPEKIKILSKFTSKSRLHNSVHRVTHQVNLSMNLGILHRDFPRLLEDKNDFFTRGRILSYERARYSSENYTKFIAKAGIGRYSMGIMFHGTAESSVDSICRNGYHPHSDFTSSLHYAVRRGQLKDGYGTKKIAHVIATAVLVEHSRQLESKDHRINNCSYYSLPLYVVKVSVS